jgi:hypothetical protein
MSHFVYALIFLALSASVASILQAKSKDEFIRYFGHRFVTPVVAMTAFSWLMFFLHKL